MHPNIGTEHVLLGLLRLEDSPAGRLLAERGMRLYAVREDAVNLYKRRALPQRKERDPVPQRVLPRSLRHGAAAQSSIR